MVHWHWYQDWEVSVSRRKLNITLQPSIYCAPFPLKYWHCVTVSCLHSSVCPLLISRTRLHGTLKACLLTSLTLIALGLLIYSVCGVSFSSAWFIFSVWQFPEHDKMYQFNLSELIRLLLYRLFSNWFCIFSFLLVLAASVASHVSVTETWLRSSYFQQHSIASFHMLLIRHMIIFCFSSLTNCLPSLPFGLQYFSGSCYSLSQQQTDICHPFSSNLCICPMGEMSAITMGTLPNMPVFCLGACVCCVQINSIMLSNFAYQTYTCCVLLHNH